MENIYHRDIDNWKKKAGGREVFIPDFGRGCPFASRYVQFEIALESECEWAKVRQLHYELIRDGLSDKWYLELHLEGFETNEELYSHLWRYLKRKLVDREDIAFSINGGIRLFRLVKPIVDSLSFDQILKEITDLFDPLLNTFFEQENNGEKAPVHYKEENLSFIDFELSSVASNELTVKQVDPAPDEQPKVALLQLNVKQVFELNLNIPEYQRIYCWGQRQITDFWNSLQEIHEGRQLHLGTIIVHKHKGHRDAWEYDIIDGQQRLVTLTLLLKELRYSGQLPLLFKRYGNEEAISNIANAKFAINEIMRCHKFRPDIELWKENLLFSVIFLQDSSLDLAYTFFSTQNSKGVPLSDFDLLKAHHLRYLTDNNQIEHLAKQWNRMTVDVSASDGNYLHTTLGTHLLRLRRWMRNENLDYEAEHPVRDEFVAAPIMECIPPFCEQFKFDEKIQGGTHFFAYSGLMVNAFKNYLCTKPAIALRQWLRVGEHWTYGDVIESLLFGYYLKFGTSYLAESLFCISGVIAKHRFDNAQAVRTSIIRNARETGIIRLISQASSPTFFLADTISAIARNGQEQEGIKWRFFSSLCNMFGQIKNEITVDEIKRLYNDEF